jgi:7-cyano-7-deazaguanine reductase
MASESQHEAEIIRSRRGLIQATPSPTTSHDYLIDLKVSLNLKDAAMKADICIRYVPDRDILQAAELNEYWHFIENARWPNEATLALTLLDDLNNEIIPRWLQIQVQTKPEVVGVERQTVTIEDNQPGWHNQRLLARIAPVSV